MEKTKLFIQIPDCISRNETSKMDSNTFAVYTYLALLHFVNYKKENQDEIKIDHNIFKHKLYISDNRTLKKAFIALHKEGYILEYINKLPTKGDLKLTFQPMSVDNITFKQIPVSIFYKMEHIGVNGLRLICYYNSFINRTDLPQDQFAYPAIETTSKALGLNKNTITKYNDILIKHNLLKVVKHKLEPTGEYNDLVEPLFTKYNNHYFVNLNIIEQKEKI